ncbi:uncharacterized protein PV06_05269 [Exophiala oligosperma]|uniref:GYF domain-containing protein n=1 Tax=Exophiala oligosperma TaxID=215243 RepID=A0A0D2DMR2_9EURO|nr:uncharacterized protein PV06_05269 [Exophiala oligosperma]KIW44243.1 hypothetical protein PV06_05269 [Exophiala oligosperma]
MSSYNKRRAEDFVRTHDHAQPSKKPRFDVRNPSALAPDAPEDDAILDADVIGSRGQQVRRGAVNIDGYDSDSDNDNFNARADAKSRAEKAAAQRSKQEEQDDMFADLEDDFRDGDDSEGDAARRGGKKKAVRFLDTDEIQGQVQNSRSGGHVSADFSLNGSGHGKGKAKDREVDDEVESSSDSEVDDEMRASTGELDPELGAGGKKAHAPKLDAFNMRTEMEEGRFDEQQNYVRKAVDPDAIHDVWLEGVSKKQMRKAKEAAERREEERRKRDIEDDAQSTGEVLGRLIPLLERGETVLEALARLGKGKDKKAKWQTKKIKKQNGNEQAEDDAIEKARKEKVEAITGAADILLTRGQPEVYDSERELLVRQYRRETGEDWVESQPKDIEAGNTSPDAAEHMWEYRWTDARDGGTINGPYTGDTMRQWSDAGYFGEGVEFRRVDGGNWSAIAEFA